LQAAKTCKSESGSGFLWKSRDWI